MGLGNTYISSTPTCPPLFSGCHGLACFPIRYRNTNSVCDSQKFTPFHLDIKRRRPSRLRGRRSVSLLRMAIKAGDELDDHFTGLVDVDGFFTVAGFGSLLSQRSALSTFPELKDFRLGKVRGYRRIFSHTCAIFFARGIARPETGEISSLSCEECEGEEIVVCLFEVKATPASIQAFIEREHEFRLLAVEPLHLDGSPTGRLAVLCGKWDDDSYRKRRCPPEEWSKRYSGPSYRIDRVWRDDVLPCRVYLRHCVLAAQRLGEDAHKNFLDHTFLADRATTIRTYLERNPDILEEVPPPEVEGRYSG
eukprot:jgi/Botrbrau1/17033/Bobra.49_2s0089.1